ncbi:MAG: C25 family cysteine peptidase [Bacteroidota bacterium]
MKNILSILFLASFVSISGQDYGNEWINYGQIYYEFKIAEDGVYRINQSTLQNAGLPLSAVDISNFQVFAKEKEIPLYVFDENGNGTLDPGDYIEFFGEQNDGWIEEGLYGGAELQNNPYYSLYNDTLLYFLTWNDTDLGLRFEEENSDNVESFSPLSHVLKYSLVEYTQNYYEGQLDNANTSLTEYTPGEGWSGNRFGKGLNLIFDVSVPTPNAYSGGGAPNAIVRSSSASHSDSGIDNTGNYNHWLLVKHGNTEVANLQFAGYQLNNVDFTIPANALGDANTTIRHEVVDTDNDPLWTGVITDYHSVNYVDITYPHTLDFSNSSYFEFQIPFNFNNGLSRIDIENFNAIEPIIYVTSNSPKRIEVINDNGIFKGLIPNQSGSINSECVVIDESEIKIISSVEKVSSSGLFTNFISNELDSAFIIISHSSLMTSAQNYAGYRQSQGLDVLLVDANDLYKQYGGGVEKCPIAFRRFADQLIDNWSSSPSHLFLLGKSIRQARESTLGARKDEIQFHKNLVPSLGYPCSDISITAGLNSTILEPTIPTGRLAATNDQQVLDYLSKVIKFEQQQNALWKKHILHFGGGNNLDEQTDFRNYLENFAFTAADTLWGAKAFGFYKDSSLPISVNTNDSIESLISEGVSLMTFFGHAYAGGFDQDIENPANIDWNDKFPLVVGNSCFTGDIHQPDAPSTSEEFVLLADKGAIGFLSSVKLGYALSLQQYTGELYQQFASKSYNKSIGQQIQATIKEIQGSGQNFFTKNVTQSMTLQGDPSLVLNTVPKPDLSISLEQISFEPQLVTLQADSFDVRVVVHNIGRTTNETFTIELNRHLPGSVQTETYAQELNGSFYSDTVVFRLPVDQANGTGINLFDCFVDLPSDVVDEMDNLNNNTVIGKSLNITAGGVIPIFPYNYAVFPNNTVTLKASTGDVFASNKFYTFQLDTNDTYSSPSFLSSTLSHPGGVINWTPPITLSDSTVYFWRVGELEDGQVENWIESSFQYIQNKEGWGQAHFKQFKNNRFNLIEQNIPDREFDFFDGNKELNCTVFGNSISLSTGYSIDGEVQEYALCFPLPGIAVAVIDPVTLEPWTTGEYSFGNFNTYDPISDQGVCRNRAELYFLFRQFETDQMAGLRDMLEDSVPDGHYILIYSLRYMSQADWNDHAPFIYTTFNDLGMNEITANQDSVPFIFFTRKGFPGSELSEIGLETNSVIELSGPLEISGEFGDITAISAGPTANWESMHWKSSTQDIINEDSLGIELFGVNTNGTNLLLESYSSLAGEDLDLLPLQSGNQMRAFLKANIADDLNMTPAQLESWHLLYESAPESAINPAISFEFYGEEIREGEVIRFHTAIENISNKDMDSLLVNYWIQDQSGTNHPIEYPRQAPLLAGEILIDTISVNSFGYPGQNTFWIEVNPRDLTTGEFDQLEQYHFNNIAQIQFNVDEDKTNPLLDVTFDGLHILDGEIVSPSPEIHIALDDENPFLLMNEEADTSFFSVFLSPEGSTEPIPIRFRNSTGEELMQFVPANSTANKSSIFFQPKELADGNYTLIVIASDKSGNESGDINYKISFEVINASMISEVMNYPNPFSTRTQFVFTLTGSEIPDYFKIEIMTISGRVVKEIFKEDLGDLRIGRNITDYYWDGTDNFGDQLANGVYLYRVITRMNDSDVTKMESNVQQFFNNGFGKMYLMR